LLSPPRRLQLLKLRRIARDSLQHPIRALLRDHFVVVIEQAHDPAVDFSTFRLRLSVFRDLGALNSSTLPEGGDHSLLVKTTQRQRPQSWTDSAG
jgi:hypothetical protein